MSHARPIAVPSADAAAPVPAVTPTAVAAISGVDVPAASLTAEDHQATSDLLRALAAPARVAIVLALRERAMCVHELVDALHLNQPQVSQHLKVLKTSGVVAGHRRGREVEYVLTDEHIAHIVCDALTHAVEDREVSA